MAELGRELHPNNKKRQSEEHKGREHLGLQAMASEVSDTMDSFSVRIRDGIECVGGGGPSPQSPRPPPPPMTQ